TTLLRAIAYKDQMEASPVTSDVYDLSGGGGGAFQMSGNQVVMEAEHYTSKTSGTDDWTFVTDASASGGASDNARQSLPNDGTAYATLDPTAAHVDYLINVPAGSAANFYVHIRDYGATSTDDSVYVSVDDSTSTNYEVTAGRTLDWKSSSGTFSIPSGQHTITVWDREDGTEIDKIVVTDSSTPPTGTGPAESVQSGPSVAAPTFSPVPGTYDTAQNVTLATTTTGATIRYTTDGSTPSETTGTVYSGPVIIGTTTTLKAIAYKTGMTDSSVTSGTYTITAFQPDGSGEFVMEAEHYTAKVTGTDDWTLITDASASGDPSDNALQSLPNDGTSYASLDPTAAHLDYLVNVPSAGNYYVHVRDYGATSTDDSVYVSVDDGTATSFVVSAARTLGWESTSGTLSLPAGVHTITVWDREDGTEIDKLVVTTSATPPTGAGPAESSRN
ncbi:MAG: chitobiase/beta-hexosaminidase C-terminal domain-containing protein, partial [Terriglobales bacterium]